MMAEVKFCKKHNYYWYSNTEYSLQCPICSRLHAAEEISKEAIDELNEVLLRKKVFYYPKKIEQ